MLHPLATYVCNCVAVVQCPELDTNRSVVSHSDPDSDPVTRYRTCGLCEKKLILSNTQICLGEYQENRLFFNLRFFNFQI